MSKIPLQGNGMAAIPKMPRENKPRKDFTTTLDTFRSKMSHHDMTTKNITKDNRDIKSVTNFKVTKGELDRMKLSISACCTVLRFEPCCPYSILMNLVLRCVKDGSI